MREEYDFSKGIKNPYTKKGKKQISINIADCVRSGKSRKSPIFNY